MAHKQIYYSDKYFDEHYEYRHVMLPRELSKQVPKTHLMSEEEWRRLGVQQSLGWVHYMIHEPEPHILLFRRPLPKERGTRGGPGRVSVTHFLASALKTEKR
ncbi:cyclin-dependent kinases regulatory subunit 2 [Callorhinus ursinus]|uniref:cyclin-dependent kinases regulatory subunit 2 n=1 Tax=Callorhinus ursinus TaxID=34884 RepID=UPI003CD029D1